MEDSIAVSLTRIESKLEQLSDLPLRVRKLEDRTIVQQFVEKILWIAIGVVITVLIQQQFLAITREKEQVYENKHNKN